MAELSVLIKFASHIGVQEYMNRISLNILFSFVFLFTIVLKGQEGARIVHANEDTSFVVSATAVTHHSSTVTRSVVVPTLGVTDFVIVQNYGNVQLSWTDTSNQNTEYFQIQRSTDNENFQTIGTLYANEGESNYGYVDQPEEAGTYFYRIRMVSIEGDFEFSNVIDAEHVIQVLYDEIEVYPNPAVDYLLIRNIQAQSAVIQIRQLDGAMLLVKNVRNDESVDVSTLPRGWVIIRVFDNGQSTFHRVLLR
jgi:hypothetical protein